MEKTEQESQLSRMTYYQQKIADHISKSRIQIIDLMKSLQSCVEISNHYKINPFSFEEIFELAKSDLNLIYLDTTQKMMLLDISREVCGIVPLHDFIIRGFIFRAIRNWQMSCKQPIIVLTKMNRLERFKIGVDILNDAKNLISKGIYINNKKVKQLTICNMYQTMLDRYEELLSVHETVRFLTGKNYPSYGESQFISEGLNIGV